ncbi:MAG TPA: single-stranded DNA-binding protein [Bdellovibrionota bacterium]|nr:single-stranded DNA-binding protein [Bdellovibrionota bacterium]
MRDLNKVFLIGRLGKDPELRTTKNGTKVAHFPLATARWIGPAPGSEAVEEGREETNWHLIVVWGRQGEACAQYLKKGSAVHVEGSVRTRKYQNKKGEDRYSTEVFAESVNFLPGKRLLLEAAADAVVAETARAS